MCFRNYILQTTFLTEALNFLKKTSTPGTQGVDGLFFLSFLLKTSEMRSKMEQLEAKFQDSEHEVSRQLLSYLKHGRKW